MGIVNARGRASASDGHGGTYYFDWREDSMESVFFRLREKNQGHLGGDRISPLGEVTAEIAKHALRSCLFCTTYPEPVKLAILEALDPKIDEWFANPPAIQQTQEKGTFSPE